jgi:hypothetical protein
MSQKKSIFTGLVMVCALCLCSPSAYAHETGSSDQQKEQLIKANRRLPLHNGHNFIPSANIKETPFITTFFQNSTGAGRAMGLTFQQAVNDWLAFWINAQGFGRIGTNAESILSQGISALGGIEVGGLGRIWRNKKMILSTAASLKHNKFIGVNIIGFAKNAIDTGIIDTSFLYNTIPSWRGKVGLRYAFAPSDLWGVIAFNDYGIGDSMAGDDKSDTVFSLGGLVSLDLSTRTVAPIGLALVYKHTSYPEASGDLVERLGLTTLKIAYTGHREFSLGLDFGFSSAPLVDHEKNLKFGHATFIIQYFF